jgi:hypothetical protein
MARSIAIALVLSGCSEQIFSGRLRDAGRDGDRPFSPRTDECGNGFDDDADARIDEDCVCVGETQPCYAGAMSERGVGACRDGVQRCALGAGVEWGEWGDHACENDARPSAEACDGVDNDCDGATDESCPCEPGSIRSCAVEYAVAPCRAGTMTCEPSGTWSACQNALGPTPDVCTDAIDNDCDGLANEGCDCTSEPERCANAIDDDCDGEIDESACLPRGDAGVVVPDGGCGMPMSCDDGLDEDCDGRIDEGCACSRVGAICPGGEVADPGDHVWDFARPWDRLSPTAIAASPEGTLYVLGRKETAAGAEVPFHGVLLATRPDGTTAFERAFGDFGGDVAGEGDLNVDMTGVAADSRGAYALFVASGVGVLGFDDGTTFRVTEPFSPPANDALVAAFDLGGDVRWVHRVGTGVAVRAIAIAGIDEVYVAGTFSGTATVGGRTIAPAGTGPDAFVAKLDASGRARFVRVVPLAGGSLGGLAVDPTTRDALLFGEIVRATDFGDAVRGIGMGESAGFLVRLGAEAGATEWSRTFTATMPTIGEDRHFARVEDVAAGTCGVRASLACRGSVSLGDTPYDCTSAFGKGILYAVHPGGAYDWTYAMDTRADFGSMGDIDIDVEGRTHVVVGVQGTIGLSLSDFTCPPARGACVVLAAIAYHGGYLGGRMFPGGANPSAVRLATVPGGTNYLLSSAQFTGQPLDLGGGATCEAGETCVARFDLCR